MKQVNLDIPVLVRNKTLNDKIHYQLCPLFFSQPNVTKRRFDVAVNQFQKEIKYNFRGYKLSRQTADHLFWHLFNPELEYQIIPYQNAIGKHYIKGRIALVSFKIKDQIFGYLPYLNQFMFMAKPIINQETQLVNQAKDIITHLFRTYKKRLDKDFNPEQYFSPKREFITVISTKVNVEFDQFKFDRNQNNWLFNRLNRDFDFNGAEEIEKVGRNLNERFPTSLNKAYYQENLVKRIYEIIYQSGNIPIVIVGEEGIGKHTLIHETVRRYLNEHYEKRNTSTYHNSRIWNIDPTRIISGMSVVGMWQKRVEAIIKYLRKPDPKLAGSDKILIDNVIAMLRIGKSSQNDMTMSDVLKPYLEKRELQVILIATPEEWKMLQENDRRFSDLFQVIRMYEPDVNTATKMILQNRKTLENQNGCDISIQAIKELLIIHRNYFKHKALPGSIMKLLQQISIKYRFSSIDSPEIREEFEDFSGLRKSIFDNTGSIKKDEIRQQISRQLVGQPDAVATLTEVIHTTKAKLNDPTKPYGSFLFIGPTGVGKTQAAKILSQYLMGDENQLMRFDMNEYIDGQAVQRLLGDVNNPEGMLTGKVRYRPFGVVLFDEIEKAHPNVRDILLQVLDDGRLTDSLGRTVDFTNTIIIMTSNIGARKVSTTLGFGDKSQNNAAIYRKAVENSFRPEFINRIDEIVIFNNLEVEHIYGIARLQIKELLQRDGFVRRTTILNVSNDALNWVAKRGFVHNMGGRALKRQIERDLTTLSAEQLINSYSEMPIILEIFIDGKKLKPKVYELSFVDTFEERWLPDLPSVKDAHPFLVQLLKIIEKIQKKLNKLQVNTLVLQGDEEEVDWAYYQFKEYVSQTKERINTLMLSYKDQNYIGPPVIPLKFKTSNSASSFRRKQSKDIIRDRWFQKDVLKEISDNYRDSNYQFNSFQTEFIDPFLDVEIAQLFVKGISKKKNKEKIRMHFASCINGLGTEECRHMITNYVAFFEKMGLVHQFSDTELYIEVEGPSIYKLMQAEAGIHLFYEAHQNPLPIKLILLKEKETLEKVKPNYKVIRIYDSGIITDLRSGFSYTHEITPSEFKVVLYAGAKALGLI